ncbi:putative permease [Halanaerobium saccharolyticum]|uniref:Putative permease n=1 Tax=Halanaerobium saccharolyticum TaxID=43595 RepID=A0A4R7Z9F2_9FIRM|nr:permease [Halanaerobium saccharolyticum]RAK11919.1 putative permease [Halanaerobium saccharolyticum]TDW07760.1 putative permease [Halanaerobium saccharolyticum]TDX64681.1 putative permease [Halanaerobium saccharolyticum]
MAKNKKKINRWNYLIFTVFVAFIIGSYFLNFDLGARIGSNFMIFARDMISILPPAFILIGLFDVWVSRESIENNFGHTSGFKKYIYAILLAATTVGGTFVAFPVANTLYHKGANYSSIFTYVTAASLVMIPMSIMEASILGIKFTAIRIGVSLPLVIISSIILGNFFTRIGYKIPKAE